MRRVGFSLLELVLAMAIVSGLVMTGVLTLRGTQVKKQSKAAAEILAEGFRMANLRARAQGFPVAVAIPTDIGKTPVARGYYMVEGEAVPPIKRGYDLGVELPEALVYSGQYPGPSWTAPPATLSRGSQFSFADWYPPFPSDAYFVFLPTGEVIANHSAADGSYRLVVATRVTYTPPVPGPDPQLPPEAMLTAVSDPYTITISTQGQVEVNAGLSGGSGGLIKSYRSLPAPDRIAFTPPMYRGPNRNPILVNPKLLVDPDPNRQIIPVVAPVGNPAITMLQDGQVQLTFFVQDPDGDQVTAAWTSQCVQPPTGTPGTWSTPDTRMRWSYVYHAWYRSSTWTPPTTANPNDRFILRCRIEDGRGGLLNPSAQSAIGYPGATVDGIDVTILPRLRLAFNTASGLEAASFDGAPTTSILTAAQLAAGSPSRMSYSPISSGLLYLNGVKPRFLDALDGTLPADVGNATQFQGSVVRGLVVAGTKLVGLVENGSNLEIQSMPAPPVSGDLSVTTPSGLIPVPTPPPSPAPSLPVSLPLTVGDFQGLIYTQPESALISSDGAGKFLFVWLGSDPMTNTVITGPPLNSLVISNDGQKVYGLLADGRIAMANLTLNGTAKTATISSETVLVSSPGCSIPTLSPNGVFLVYKSSAGQANLVNLNTAETSTLTINNYTDMVWSEK